MNKEWERETDKLSTAISVCVTYLFTTMHWDSHRMCLRISPLKERRMSVAFSVNSHALLIEGCLQGH